MPLTAPSFSKCTWLCSFSVEAWSIPVSPWLSVQHHKIITRIMPNSSPYASVIIAIFVCTYLCKDVWMYGALKKPDMLKTYQHLRFQLALAEWSIDHKCPPQQFHEVTLLHVNRSRCIPTLKSDLMWHHLTPPKLQSERNWISSMIPMHDSASNYMIYMGHLLLPTQRAWPWTAISMANDGNKENFWIFWAL